MLIIWGTPGFLALVAICTAAYIATSYHDAYLFKLHVAGELPRKTQIKINLTAFFVVLLVSLVFLYFISVLSYELAHEGNSQ